MDITRVGRRGASTATSIPPHILRALDVRPGDYIAWTFNTAGCAEVRRVPRAHEIAKAAARRT
ncbi:MAG: hypothetical protein ACREU1_12620 [Burkholderiales bacterium]